MTKTFATLALSVQGRRHVIVAEEGKEPPEFWKLLGNNTGYPYNKDFWKNYTSTPRLFRWLNLPSEPLAQEVINFVQSDLNINEFNVYMLDLYTDIFVWHPVQFSDKLLVITKSLAEDFKATAEKARKIQIKLNLVCEGKETQHFSGHFYGWVQKAQFVDPRIAAEEKLKLMLIEEAKIQAQLEAEKQKEIEVQQEKRRKELEEARKKFAEEEAERMKHDNAEQSTLTTTKEENKQEEHKDNTVNNNEDTT